MKLTSEITLEPLEGKYYETVILVDLGNHRGLRISIGGWGGEASEREKKNGWEPDYGMDHVETQDAYEVAKKIVKLLEDKYNDF